MDMKKLLCILALLLLAPFGVRAGTIGAHVGSLHVPLRHFESFNPGVYYRWANGVQVGVLRNSERRLSTYGAWTWQRGRFSLSMGAITGYRRAKVLPLVAPGWAVVDRPDFKARIILLPQAGRDASTALHLVVEF